MRSPRPAAASILCQNATAFSRDKGCMKPTEAPLSTQSSSTSASDSAMAVSAPSTRRMRNAPLIGSAAGGEEEERRRAEQAHETEHEAEDAHALGAGAAVGARDGD